MLLCFNGYNEAGDSRVVGSRSLVIIMLYSEHEALLRLSSLGEVVDTNVGSNDLLCKNECGC